MFQTWGPFPHKDERFKALGKHCHKCNGKDHLAKMCWSGRCKQGHANVVSTETPEPEQAEFKPACTSSESAEDTDPEYAYAFQGASRKLPTCVMEIKSQQPVVAMGLIDTGTTVNIIDSATSQKIVPQPQLHKPSISIYPYGESSTKLPVLGTAMLTTAIPSTNENITAEFHVVNGNSGNLLSWRTAEKFNLVKVTCHVSTNQKPEFIKNYESMFKGIGEIDGVEIKLHIDDKVQPKQQRHRRIPFHIRKDVEKELQRLQELDIIEKVEGPTPWVSPIAVVPKSTGVHICVDMFKANHAIQRERHPTPTIEDMVADLNG